MESCSVADGGDGSLTVEFIEAADPGVAPGQFAVLYDGEECLGGGVME
jgi:tRNA-specific 2-thiouridylase